jgi:hypothetical protein
MATKKQMVDADAASPVKCRVLMSCSYGQPDDVIELPADEAQAGQDAGELDPDPAAVAYAESLLNT